MALIPIRMKHGQMAPRVLSHARHGALFTTKTAKVMIDIDASLQGPYDIT